MLEENECDHIFQEKIREDRPRFNKLLKIVKNGDTIIVTKSFVRSTKDALATIEQLNVKGIGLVVLNMGGYKEEKKRVWKII